MNCPNCGSNLAVKGKFCPNCGTSIPEDLYIRLESKSEILDHGRVAEAQAQQTMSREKTKRGRGRIFIAIILILVLGAVAIFALLVIDKNNGWSFLQTQSTVTPATGASTDPLPSINAAFADDIAAHNKEVERLQKLEDDILEDIKQENYEMALTKTTLLRYTDSWSQTAKKEWDNKREALVERLNYLLNKETETKGN